jgi:outer membrane protein assembly factor BamA
MYCDSYRYSGIRYVLITLAFLNLTQFSPAQSAKDTPTYPSHLPYRFKNVPWWCDEELRALLKKRLPGLGDEVATTTAAEGRIRDALKALLKEKGVIAEIQSEEPSLAQINSHAQSPAGTKLPPSLPPAVLYSIFKPDVLVDKVQVKADSPETEGIIAEHAAGWANKPFNANLDFYSKSILEEQLARKGYLDAKVGLEHGAVHQDGERYLVDVIVQATAGPKYHVSMISADGGPLLQGKDLSQFIKAKAGDPAGDAPFGTLGLQIRALYEHMGYEDVQIDDGRELERSTETVSYHMNVVPGPVYHLRTLSIRNLDANQEAKARELLGIKAGDLYDGEAVTRLYRAIKKEPLLAARGFSYSRTEDPATGALDLELKFFKEGGEATVTVH